MQRKKTARSIQGFSMAEMLITVAIIAILSGVVFIGVAQYLRSMAQVERDGIAKEIFVAAQNHLTMAKEQGYLGLSNYGETDPDDETIHYFAVSPGSGFDEDALIALMLPFGSVDETVRAGGSYIVRYQPEEALVLDVFYTTPSGTRYGHSLGSGDYEDCLNARDADGASNRNARRTFGGDRAVLGWYGGEEALALEKGAALKTPVLEVINKETLTVRLTDPNKGNTDASLKLLITGKTSGERVSITLTQTTVDKNVSYDASAGEYTVTLDDITREGLHFSELFPDFLPGEDITIQAVAYSSSVLTNVAYSAEAVTNSLYADPEDPDAVRIAYVRHLENLDPRVSNAAYGEEALHIANAKQVSDLSWKTFLDEAGEDASVLHAGGSTGSESGTYLPVCPGVKLTYDGDGHTIDGIVINTDEDAGLFGTLENESTVSNLMLTGFDVTSTGGAAGALAGTAEGTAFTNIVAAGKDASVKASGSAGGLIGSVTGGSVEACAASVLTESTGGDAGGLIGSASGASVKDSYSGGHTADGVYGEEANVKASGSAGGLIGSVTGGSTDAVTNCYSTCSVAGSTAGGLAGTSAGAAFTGCYAAGKVDGTTEGALFGSFAGTASDCLYYEIINERTADDGTISYLAPGVEGAEPFDESLASWTAFAGDDREGALAHDPVLIRDYRGKYALRTIGQMDDELDESYFVNTHYGDWPSPETEAVNTAG